MKLLAVSLALCAFAPFARADQCQIVDADTAAAAVKLVTDKPTLDYCEPCNDKPPTTAPKKIGRVAVSAKYDESVVTIDGKEVDLAYLFVQTGKTTWTNVGLMVGCGAKKVSGFLTIGAAAKR
jgi:hypothetical protein